MTDKALEDAMEAGFRKGADEFQPDPEMFVCMDATGCYHVSWNATEHRAKMASLKSTHEAHYVLSALPGEAEVVAWAYRGPRGGLIVTEEKPEHAPEAAPLVTLASLQAMQARAEAAEDAENEAKDCFWAIYPKYLEMGGEPIDTEAARTDLAKRAEAAEARVKELTAALEFYAKPENYKGEFVPGGRTDHGTFAMAHHVNAVRKDAGEIARKALQHNGEGDTNG